jgi:hypothetical protein
VNSRQAIKKLTWILNENFDSTSSRERGTKGRR